MVVYVCALMQVHVSVGCEIYELVFRAQAVERGGPLSPGKILQGPALKDALLAHVFVVGVRADFVFGVMSGPF